jgi:copper chaperone CopZ
MPTSRTALPLSSQVCGGEHQTLERILLEVEGVVTAVVNPASEMAYVEYDPARTDPTALFGVLKHAGFTPEDRSAVRGARGPGVSISSTGQGGQR